ncbi:collagenase [Spirochaeta isovalerica]|uniref:Uncharacterized protein n=1 Tax=Spirochaeta isovalerica TaxID=150 RepID=A0A841R828_9SPIO|nr:collagenase [Spirochaeta isovalerica]MBB6479190.1 hypothetical protein [Spirochaeta isovalerica]
MRRLLPFFALFLPALLWSHDFTGWNRISTEHYTFIFEEFDEETASELAGYSEEIYTLVTEFFDYRPGHISIYLNSRVDLPNGNFYPLPGSIVLYPAYPLNCENTTGSSSWLYELLLHEMVHYVQLEKPVGMFGGLSRVFGKDLASANGAFLPAWMVEGIAVYLESRYTGGGRGNNLYFQAYTKAAAWEDKYFTLEQLAYSSDFPPYNRIYSGGYILTRYMIETFGDDIISRIYNRYARFPLFGPFYAVKKETGKSLTAIFEDMKASEKEKYNSTFMEASAFLSWPIGKSGDSVGDYIHPLAINRGTVAYRREQSSPTAIIFLDENGREEVLVETPLIEGSSFSTDNEGRSLVFASPEYELYHSYGYSLISDLYLFENGKIDRLTENESLFQPALSASGDKIIAVQRNGSYSRLVSVDRISGHVKVLFEKERTNIMNPQFSQKGEELVFTLNEKGYQDIWILDLSDPASARPLLGQDRYMEYHPRFTDEGKITFISDRSGELALYLYDRVNKSIHLIFKDPVGVADAYVKNGTVFYQTYRTNGYTLMKGVPVFGDNLLEEFDAGKEILFSESPAAVIAEKSKHLDLALPYLWLPRPFVENSRSEGMIWGAGAAVFAGSVSQSTEWLLNLGFLPGPKQLTGSLDYNRKMGRATLNYRIAQDYKEYISSDESIWNQKTEQTLLISYPFFETGFAGRRQVMSHYVYTKHLFSASDAAPFSFIDGFALNGENFLYGGTGISYDVFRINNARSALFGGTGLHNQLDFSVLLPVFSAGRTSLLISESGNMSLSLSQRGTRWKTAWKAAWHNGGYSSAAVQSRGWTAGYTPSDISLYYSTSLQVPLALLDWGLPLGFNIRNLAFAVNLEGISNFLLEGPEGHEFYGSVELIGTYGYNYGSIPFGAGISFRFFNNGFSFDPAADLALYIFFSFNSP